MADQKKDENKTSKKVVSYEGRKQIISCGKQAEIDPKNKKKSVKGA